MPTRREFSAEEILETASGYQKSRIILTAFELDVFTVIGKDSLSSEEIARAIQAKPRSTDRLLNALCAVGLLRKERGLFSNTPASLRYLVRGGEGYLSRLGHMIAQFRSWATLTEAVKAGRSVTAREYDEVSLVRFIEAMHARAEADADKVVSLIGIAGARRMLDVGGGSGVYSIAFARADNNLTAVVFDLPKVTPIAERYISAAGLSDRVTTMAGDYRHDDFGAGYDLVFMSAIIHINSPEENRALAAKAFRCLNPGGRIVIQDFIMNEDRTAPERGALFALNMLVNTQHGDTYTENEIRDWLLAAGFTDIRRIGEPPERDFIIGVKTV